MIVRTYNQLQHDRYQGSLGRGGRKSLEWLLSKWIRGALPNRGCELRRIFQMDGIDAWILEYDNPAEWTERAGLPWKDRPPVELKLVDRPTTIRFT